MNTEIQIKTGDFEYINRKINTDSDVEAVEKFLSLKKTFQEVTQSGEGLTKKEFDEWLDIYLETNKGNADLYYKMNLEQQVVIQSIKRAVKRIEAKQNNNV